MNNPQGPNKTVPQNHPCPQAVVPTVMSTFSLGPGQSTSVLAFADAATVKLNNKPIILWSSRLMEKLTAWLFLGKHEGPMQSFQLVQPGHHPLADTMMRNLLTHYGEVTLSNYIDHGNTYVTTQTRNAKTMTCSTISWWILWKPSSEPRYYFMLTVTLLTMLLWPLPYSSKSSF